MTRVVLPAVAALMMSSAAVIAAEPAATKDASPSTPSTTEGPIAPAPAEKMAPDAAAPAPRAAAPSVTSTDSASLTLSDDQAKQWINKVVYSSDNKNLGEVVAFARDASGHVTEMHADLGGFLGIGEKRVRVSPSDFMLSGDRVVLKLTADQAKTLPAVPNT